MLERPSQSPRRPGPPAMTRSLSGASRQGTSQLSEGASFPPVHLRAQEPGPRDQGENGLRKRLFRTKPFLPPLQLRFSLEQQPWST
ncbi:Membrane-Spanning 4-Domains Subfamily A Member 6E [Manis pentadactyla]|nr:Membrane-Spanning 4-Domains Subfamily A Member 6E [Manis pentadactyla]